MRHKSEGITLSEKETLGRTLTAGKIQDSNVEKNFIGKSGGHNHWVIKNNNDSPISVEVLEED